MSHNNSKPKVVYHFFLDPRLGGPHYYVSSKAFYFAGRFKQIVYVSGKGIAADRELLNMRRLWRPLYILEIFFNAFMIIYDVLFGRISREGAIFNVHGGATLAPIVAARLSRIPVLWVIHETTPSYRIFIKIGQLILKGKESAVIAIVSRRALEVYGLSRATFLPASVDESFWDYKNVTDSEINECDWSAPRNKKMFTFRILTVGNLNPLKGFDLLLEALSTFKDSFNLKIVGSKLETHRVYANRLTEKAVILEKLSSDRRIDFLGWQSKEQVRALLASCDIFVLPSLSEACPIALLEAMAMGCRIVAADVGDVSVMLESCSKSNIFEAGSASELAKAIGFARSQVHLEVTGEKKSCIGPEWQLSHVAEETAIVYRRLFAKSS